MKKLVLLSAILLGAATASQAGVRFNIGIGLPVPVPAVVVPLARVYVQPPAAAYVAPAPDNCPAPQAYCPPAETHCPPSVVVAPPVIDFRLHHDHEPEWRSFPDGRDHQWHL